MTDFSRLDEDTATLRILLNLSHIMGSTSRSQLIRELAKEGVGRSALFSSLKTLRDLGLIVDEKILRGNRKAVGTRLTSKGLEIAEIINQLVNVLEKSSNVRINGQSTVPIE